MTTLQIPGLGEVAVVGDAGARTGCGDGDLERIAWASSELQRRLYRVWARHDSTSGGRVSKLFHFMRLLTAEPQCAATM
jgi:hypothetical protein